MRYPVILLALALALSAAACRGEGGRAEVTPGSSPAITTPSPLVTTSSPLVATPSPTASPADLLADSTVVRFPSLDGTSLTGRLFGSGPNGVVLAHQIDDSETAWFPFAQRLRTEGYRVLTFDFQGYCDDDAPCSKGAVYPATTWKDVVGAHRFLVRRGASTVALIGASMGGEAVIVAAGKPGVTPSALVTLSASKGLVGLFDDELARAAIAKIAAPKLFVAGEFDTGFAQDAKDYDAFSEPAHRLVLYPTGDHGIAILDGAEGPAAADLLIGFLSANV